MKGETVVMQPKKALCGFQFFNHELMRQLKEKDPSLKLVECVKKAGEMWPKLSEKERLKYEERQVKDKCREERQRQELADKGYFTLDDGTKSCNLPYKVKKQKKQ